MTRFITKNI